MKKYFFMLAVLFLAGKAFAQNTGMQTLKLYVAATGEANPNLDAIQLERLKAKLVQVINNSGIAEMGYSTFLVHPKFYINEVRKTEGLVRNFTTASCELNIFISRVSVEDGQVEAHMASYMQKLTGSGTDSSAAITNAINQITANDKRLNEFIGSG